MKQKTPWIPEEDRAKLGGLFLLPWTMTVQSRAARAVLMKGADMNDSTMHRKPKQHQATPDTFAVSSSPISSNISSSSSRPSGRPAFSRIVISLLVCVAAALCTLLAGCEQVSQVSQVILPSKNTLRVAVSRQLSGDFGPLTVRSTEDAWVSALLFESMLDYNENSELEPMIAQDLPRVSDDGLTILWTLRPDQKFSDGSTLDGNDVRYTFRLLADPDAISSAQEGMFDFIEGWKEYRDGLADEISGITVSDDGLQVRFVCEKADIDAVTLIGSMYILSDEQFDYVKGSLDSYRSIAPEDLVGSGPYVIESFDQEDGLKASLNPNYTGRGEYAIESIEIKTMDSSQQLTALENGDIDLIPNQSSIHVLSQVLESAEKNDSIELDSCLRPGMYYIGLNTQSGPTSEEKVRQALAYAIDGQAFVDHLFDDEKIDDTIQEELRELCQGYVPQAFWSPVAGKAGQIAQGKAHLDGLLDYDYDLEKARALLDEAGWKEGEDGIREKNGRRLEIRFLTMKDNEILKRLFPYLAACWKDIGVDLKTNTISFASLLETIAISSDETLDDWNAFFLSIAFTDTSSAWMNAVEGFSQTSGKVTPNSSNYARLCSDELNALLRAGKLTADPTHSLQMYEKAMVLASSLCAYIPIYGGNMVNIRTSRLQNLHTGPLYPWPQALDGAVLLSRDEQAVQKEET